MANEEGWSESLDAALKAAASGAVFGAPFGVMGKLWGGGKKISDLLRGAMVGGGLGGGAAGGSVLAGSALLGEPGPGETSPYTARAGLGGALTGGGLGGLLGGLAAAGKLPKSLPASIMKYLPQDNILTRKIAKSSIPAGAAMGAGALGLPTGLYGMDEGMGVDVIMNEMQKDKLRRRLMEGY